MCHVSKISAANRPLTPPRIWFRRTGGGQPRPMVWARGRMRHSVLGREAARMRHEITSEPKMADLREARLYRVTEYYSV